jgi:hypothetical protein
MGECTNAKQNLKKYVFLNLSLLIFYISLNLFSHVNNIATHRYGGLVVPISSCNDEYVNLLQLSGGPCLDQHGNCVRSGKRFIVPTWNGTMRQTFLEVLDPT